MDPPQAPSHPRRNAVYPPHASPPRRPAPSPPQRALVYPLEAPSSPRPAHALPPRPTTRDASPGALSLDRILSESSADARLPSRSQRRGRNANSPLMVGGLKMALSTSGAEVHGPRFNERPGGHSGGMHTHDVVDGHDTDSEVHRRHYHPHQPPARNPIPSGFSPHTPSIASQRATSAHSSSFSSNSTLRGTPDRLSRTGNDMRTPLTLLDRIGPPVTDYQYSVHYAGTSQQPRRFAAKPSETWTDWARDYVRSDQKLTSGMKRKAANEGVADKGSGSSGPSKKARRGDVEPPSPAEGSGSCSTPVSCAIPCSRGVGSRAGSLAHGSVMYTALTPPDGNTLQADGRPPSDDTTRHNDEDTTVLADMLHDTIGSTTSNNRARLDIDRSSGDEAQAENLTLKPTATVPSSPESAALHSFSSDLPSEVDSTPSQSPSASGVPSAGEGTSDCLSAIPPINCASTSNPSPPGMHHVDFFLRRVGLFSAIMRTVGHPPRD